jgi:primary-amine oxidase
MAIAPVNYFAGDVSRSTIHGVRVNFDDKSQIIDRITFGTTQPTCAYDMVEVAPNLSSFIGEITIPKFPWDPSGSLQTNPGG